jgi:hypothetical protein
MVQNRLFPVSEVQSQVPPRAWRVPGPGSLYNAGNILGLVVGSGAALAQGAGSSTQALAQYFVGDGAAIALTVATLGFFVSGRIYDRAWRSAGERRVQLMRAADGLSGVGAIVLGVSIALVASPALALASATLHATSKLGSAVTAGRRGVFIRRILRGTRWLVLGSRALGFSACVSGLTIALQTGGPNSGRDAIMSATLLVCYLLWASADMLLLRSAS